MWWLGGINAQRLYLYSTAPNPYFYFFVPSPTMDKIIKTPFSVLDITFEELHPDNLQKTR
jgi:hypothetical protein